MCFHHQVTGVGESRPAWHIAEVRGGGIERYGTWCLSPREFSGTRDQLEKGQQFQRPFLQEFTLDIKKMGTKAFFKELFLGVEFGRLKQF